MVPEDGEAAPPTVPRAQAGAPGGTPGGTGGAPGDAYAATIAPAASTPGTLPAGTPVPPAHDDELESDVTLAAPGRGAPADGASALPVVSLAHYQMDREIARGGMGRIVAAEDQRLGRRVALKELLEPAGDQLGRFAREALITARLQHPGIVPVYEAGRWPTGEPFFAMKLVSGRPLDRVIADARTLEDRLALLPRITAAANAIAYAHNQRVVHRDLKPGNVLIGDFGETVVIDWGLAKDLDADHDDGGAPERPARARQRSVTRSGSPTLTVAGAVMGTPAYMAPEQARGEAVDQRADVFALGAMLYHLLAGVPPYDARTGTDVIAAAAAGKVVPLEARERRAPRDLVAIVERAMAPLPVDRYPHAGELADELRRFLTGQLVTARDYTTLQRVGRFVAKHRAAATIAAIAVAGFVVGGTLAVRSIVRERDNADRERTLAVTRGRAAEKLIDEMLNDMKDRLSTIGRLDLLANLGGEVRDYYTTLSKIPGGMRFEDVDRMAIAVELVGRAERDSGQSDRALATWTEARSRLARVVGGDVTPATRFKRVMIARLDFQIGTIYQQRGKSAAALAAYGKAEAEYAALAAEAPNDRLILLGSAENQDRLGDLQRNDGKLDGAFEAYSAARAARERASHQTSSRPSEEVLALSTSHLKLGSIHQARGDSAAALASYRASARLRETVLEGQPDNVQVQEKLLEVQDALAELHRLIGDAASAIETYQQAMPVMDALVRRDPSNTTWRRQRGNLLADLGFTLLDTGEFTAGLDQLELAIASQQELVARDPKNSTWSIDLSQSFTRAGDGYIYAGARDRGLDYFERALAIRERLARRDPNSAPYRRSVAWAHTKLAGAHVLAGELDRAIAAHERARELRARLVAESPAQVGFTNELASTEVSLGKLIAARDAARAASLIDSGLNRARTLVGADALSNEWKRTLVQGLVSRAELARVRGDLATRRAALDEALAVATEAAGRAPQNVHWAGWAAEVQAARAELAGATGDPAGAAAARRAIRDALEPLAKAGRLPAPRKALLERAR
ncbi:MAG: protein kinase domain-containing protein [Kofleriaceae bacterium]